MKGKGGDDGVDDGVDDVDDDPVKETPFATNCFSNSLTPVSSLAMPPDVTNA